MNVCTLIAAHVKNAVQGVGGWGGSEGLWHASLVRVFHQLKSVPLYSAACLANGCVRCTGSASRMMHLHAA